MSFVAIILVEVNLYDARETDEDSGEGGLRLAVSQSEKRIVLPT